MKYCFNKTLFKPSNKTSLIRYNALYFSNDYVRYSKQKYGGLATLSESNFNQESAFLSLGALNFTRGA
jgi:hypothetical protein